MSQNPIDPGIPGLNSGAAWVALYEDNHLIAVNKQAGEIVQGDKTGDVPMSDRIAEYIRVKYGKPGDAFIGVGAAGTPANNSRIGVNTPV